MSNVITTLQIPIPFGEFDLPSPLRTKATTITEGPVGWNWSGDVPNLGIERCPDADGTAAEGWDLDHILLLTGDLSAAIDSLRRVGLKPRLRTTVGGRQSAFFRVGPLIEVVESPVRHNAIFGIALVTSLSLEVISLQWRSMGRDVADPIEAQQPGRRIVTVRATEIGLAVISEDRARY